MTLYIDTKPTLEWVERKDGHKFYADIYELQKTVSGRWIVIIGGYVEKPYFETAEHGKQYAQADYQRRTDERFIKVGNLHNDLMYLLDIKESINNNNHLMTKQLINDWIENMQDLIKQKK